MKGMAVNLLLFLQAREKASNNETSQIMAS
jgi:hypothetical protein